MKNFVGFPVAIWLLLAGALQAQPTFTPGGNVTVNQNSGPYSSSQPWATNIVATTPQFEVTDISFEGFLTFTSDPVIDASGFLTFEPTQDRSGTAIVTVVLHDLSTGETSIPVTFRIFVNFVNSAPSFDALNADQTIDEDAGAQTVLSWATNISAGPNPEENTQQINFVATVTAKTTYMDFTLEPYIDKTGTLFYEVAPNANGSATISVVLQDDGSSAPPNENTSAPLTFTITVNPINDPPYFTIGPNINIDEHNGPFSMTNWATNISAGAPDEDASQQITFILNTKSITTYLQYDADPAVDTSGTLTFTATPHYNGTAVYEIYLQDDGPSTPPHDNTSPVQGFSITVDFINDAPSFTIGPDIVVDEGDQTYSLPGWATNISPGESPNEQDQALNFTVVFQQVSGNLAFLRAPTIDDTGLLTFRPTQHTHGEAIFDVYLTDDGQYEPPHQNQSDKQSFKITVNKVNYPPTDIILNNTRVLEKQPAGTLVGQLRTEDLDPEDTFDYALVPGDGADNNDLFAIDGDQLVTADVFDWETQKTLTCRIKTSDGEFSFEKSFVITIEKLIEGIKFPNAFTPNGDGENDTWELEDIEAFPNATVAIYDNTGRRVYYQSQGYQPWDGTFNGTKLPMGTYYYVIDLHDGKNIYKGTVTIIL